MTGLSSSLFPPAHSRYVLRVSCSAMLTPHPTASPIASSVVSSVLLPPTGRTRTSESVSG